MIKRFLYVVLAILLTAGSADARVLRGGAETYPKIIGDGVSAGLEVTFNNGNSWVGSCTANTYADLTVDATNNLKVTSATLRAANGVGFLPTDVGHPLLTATNNGVMPTGWTQGLFKILSVDGNGAAYLASSAAAAGTSGGYFQYGIASDCQYFHNKHLNKIRVPFNWETMQHTLGGALYTPYVVAVEDIIRQGTYLGFEVIPDCHNFAGYNGLQIGMPGGPTDAQFANLWIQLATAFQGWGANYDIMNEPPNGYPVATWVAAAQAAINGIRTVDTVAVIYVEGVGYASAFQWISNGNNLLLTLVDPYNNLKFSAHSYLDSDNSGSYPVVQLDTGPVESNDAVTNGTGVVTSVEASQVNPQTGLTGFQNLTVGKSCYIGGGTANSGSGITPTLYQITALTSTSVTLNASLPAGSNGILNCGGPAVNGGCTVGMTTYQCAVQLKNQLTSPPSPLTTNILVQRYTVFVNWCQFNHVKCWIGETGVPFDDNNWLVGLDLGVQYLKGYGVDFTYWAGSGWASCITSATNGNIQNCSYRLGVYPYNLPNSSAPSAIPVDTVPMAVLDKLVSSPQQQYFQLYGPNRGSSGTPSAQFQLVYNGYIPNPFTVTWNDGGAGGTFSNPTFTCSGPYNCVASTTYTAPANNVYVINATTSNSFISNGTGPIGYATISDQFYANNISNSNILNALSVGRKIFAPYLGSTVNLRRGSDSATKDFGFTSQALNAPFNTAALVAWNGTTETDTLASTKIIVQNSSSFFADAGVHYQGGANLTKVLPAIPPAVGQYSVSSTGTYTFNTGEIGNTIVISYIYPTYLVKWYDQGPNGNNGGMIVADGPQSPSIADQPGFITNCQGGLPCLQFGGHNRMDIQAPLNNLTQLSSLHVFAPTWHWGDGTYFGWSYSPAAGSTPGTSYIFEGPGTPDANYPDSGMNDSYEPGVVGVGPICCGNGSGQFRAYSVDNTFNAIGFSWATGDVNQQNVNIKMMNNGEFVNQNSTTASVMYLNYGRANANLGYARFGAASWLGQASEIINVTTALTNNQMQSFQTDQDTQWGMPSGANYIYYTPTLPQNTVTANPPPWAGVNENGIGIFSDGGQGSVLTGSISSGLLTATVTSGSLSVGQIITGAGIPAGVTIVSGPTAPATNPYTLSNLSLNVSSETMYTQPATGGCGPGGMNGSGLCPHNGIVGAAAQNYYAQHVGLNLIRLVISWQDLQPSLCTGNTTINPQVLATLDQTIAYMNQAGMDAMIDIHNFGGYNYSAWTTCASPPDNGNLASSTTQSYFLNLMSQLTTHYAGNPKVDIDMMNEPVSVTNQVMASIGQSVITTGRTNGFTGYFMWEPGNSYGACEEVNGTSFTGQTASGILTVTNLTGGRVLTGDALSGAGIPIGTYIGTQISGTTNGNGTYNLSNGTLAVGPIAMTSGAGNAFMAMTDTSNKKVLECHSYANTSAPPYYGYCGNDTCGDWSYANFYLDHLKPAGDWCAANGCHLLWGEFNLAYTREMYSAMKKSFDYMAANPSVWYGYTEYTAGAAWGEGYYGLTEPRFFAGQTSFVTQTADRPMMRFLNTYATGHTWPAASGSPPFPYDIKYPYNQ